MTGVEEGGVGGGGRELLIREQILHFVHLIPAFIVLVLDSVPCCSGSLSFQTLV